jgi:hypothetical protein
VTAEDAEGLIQTADIIEQPTEVAKAKAEA